MTDLKRAAAGRKGGAKTGKSKRRPIDYSALAKSRRRHCPTCTCAGAVPRYCEICGLSLGTLTAPEWEAAAHACPEHRPGGAR